MLTDAAITLRRDRRPADWRSDSPGRPGVDRFEARLEAHVDARHLRPLSDEDERHRLRSSERGDRAACRSPGGAASRPSARTTSTTKAPPAPARDGERLVSAARAVASPHVARGRRPRQALPEGSITPTSRSAPAPGVPGRVDDDVAEESVLGRRRSEQLRGRGRHARPRGVVLRGREPARRPTAVRAPARSHAIAEATGPRPPACSRPPPTRSAHASTARTRALLGARQRRRDRPPAAVRRRRRRRRACPRARAAPPSRSPRQARARRAQRQRVRVERIALTPTVAPAPRAPSTFPSPHEQPREVGVTLPCDRATRRGPRARSRPSPRPRPAGRRPRRATSGTTRAASTDPDVCRGRSPTPSTVRRRADVGVGRAARIDAPRSRGPTPRAPAVGAPAGGGASAAAGAGLISVRPAGVAAALLAGPARPASPPRPWYASPPAR